MAKYGRCNNIRGKFNLDNLLNFKANFQKL